MIVTIRRSRDTLCGTPETIVIIQRSHETSRGTPEAIVTMRRSRELCAAFPKRLLQCNDRARLWCGTPDRARTWIFSSPCEINPPLGLLTTSRWIHGRVSSAKRSDIGRFQETSTERYVYQPICSCNRIFNRIFKYIRVLLSSQSKNSKLHLNWWETWCEIYSSASNIKEGSSVTSKIYNLRSVSHQFSSISND